MVIISIHAYNVVETTRVQSATKTPDFRQRTVPDKKNKSVGTVMMTKKITFSMEIT
jgi:hypothetical protein